VPLLAYWMALMDGTVLLLPGVASLLPGISRSSAVSFLVVYWVAMLHNSSVVSWFVTMI
jgi:hypothetical protein